MTAHWAHRVTTILITVAIATTPLIETMVEARAQSKAAAASATDPGWPRTYATASKGHITVYEPQIASWAGQKHLVAYAAASYQSAGATTTKPTLGTIRLEAQTRVSLDERLVNFANMRIAEATFHELPRASLQEAVAEITKSIPVEDRVISLDRVLAFVDKSAIVPKDVPGVKADPPAIAYSEKPAVLVNFDGMPIWSPIEGNDLKFAVNTNWDVFEHGPTQTYYLRHERSWFTATDLNGAWSIVSKLPASFATLPADENFKEVKAAVPAKSMPARERPTIIVRTEPAELILLNGAPSYLLVPAAKDLLWVQNTESDVFRMGKNGPVYYLVTGRWFSAPDFNGPWTFASTALPDDFKRIPLEHQRSRVLASVPGSAQAIEAVLLAQVPQTARINKTQIQAPPVGYQGAPEFTAIEGTNLQRAVNTDKDVIRDGATYYYCYQGVWFVGKGTDGPWQVATTIPAAIYSIPASSPSHHVTYVVIEEDDDPNDAWVTYAYVAGYTGLMVGWGCVVWGSGWYYPPYVYYGPHPIYYPYFPTYGYSAWYNPWTGTFGRAAVAYGPYGGMGAAARYNPRTGRYARGAVAWGPYGASGGAQVWNPRTGTYAQTRQGSNIYGSWGSTYVQRGDDWVQSARYTNRITGNTTRIARTDDGNIYAGRDGNVYRRQDGEWQKHENGEWGGTNRPTPYDPATVGQLERDRTSRTEAAERTRDYGSVKSTGTRATGSYRGGNARSGGGRRR